MYFLGYVELFHPQTHVFDETSWKDINEFYITIFTIKSPSKYLHFLTEIKSMHFEEYYCYISENKSREIMCHKTILFHIKNRTKELCIINNHPIIRNFFKIQESLYNPTSLEIVEKIVLKTGESICILKTFWIKCIQRKWKKICEYNKKILNDLMMLKNVKRRDIINIHSKFYGLNGLWYSIPRSSSSLCSP
jgi:hypothetical protein